jgi:hypothetical protein
MFGKKAFRAASKTDAYQDAIGEYGILNDDVSYFCFSPFNQFLKSFFEEGRQEPYVCEVTVRNKYVADARFFFSDGVHVYNGGKLECADAPGWPRTICHGYAKKCIPLTQTRVNAFLRDMRQPDASKEGTQRGFFPVI